MSATRDDGGPAFPGTLRDWFAGQALSQMPDTAAAVGREVATLAYAIADAMLAERAKVERGQAPDPPTAVVLDTVAAQPAPASCGAEKTWGTNKDILCDREKGHEGVHSYGGASPHSMTWVGDADLPAAPAHAPHCLNCGLVLDSARDYCLVCGCEAWLFSQRESDIKCTLRAGHDGDHLNGAVSWGGSS